PWAFTTGDLRWYNLSWLFDLAISTMQQWLDIHSLYAFTVLLLAGLGAAMARDALQKGAWLSAVLAVCLLMPFMAYGGVLLRPNLISAPFTVIFYLVLSSESRKERFYHLATLPAATACWVNCHGGVLGGFVVLGAFFLAALV